MVRGIYNFYASRIRSNRPGFFREFAFYLVAVVISAGLDFASTCQFMSEGGIDDELHPLIRIVSHLFGPVMGPLFGKLGQLAAVVFLTLVFRRAARVIFIPVIVIYLYAAWFNTYGVTLYTPLFLRLIFRW
ncbi:MAG: hypothetical protein WCH43_00660 [Verrucomicrobiota bacterium]